MDRLNRVKFHVDRMLNYIETHEGLSNNDRSNYGYTQGYYGRREHYDAYVARKYIAYDDYDRSQITKTMLKDMKKFLDIAKELGFIGDVWFKTGYSHGMYASTRTGNDLEGELVLYHTFSSDNNYFELRKGRNRNEKIIKRVNTKSQLKSLMK